MRMILASCATMLLAVVPLRPSEINGRLAEECTWHPCWNPVPVGSPHTKRLDRRDDDETDEERIRDDCNYEHDVCLKHASSPPQQLSEIILTVFRQPAQ